MKNKLRRRDLATALLAALPLPASAQRTLPAGHRRFREVAASLYAWDLEAESPEAILDTLRETARVNSVYLVALMHHERRPLTDYYFPHNPKRKRYFPEDSRTYWRPNAASYRSSRIKPLATEREEFRKTDWLTELIAVARKKGLKTGAEISHTVLDKERARGQFQDVIQRDIWGNRLGQLICHNHPDARAYVLALFHDLAANYDLDYVQTCMLPVAPARLPVQVGVGGDQHRAGSVEFGFWAAVPEDLREAFLATTLGGCFCEHCAGAARKAGFDLAAIRRALLPVANAQDHPTLEEAQRQRVRRGSNASAALLLVEHPEILDLIRCRCATMTRVYVEIGETVRRARSGIDFRENAHIKWAAEFAGLDYRQIRPALGSIRSSDYSEQTGRTERLEDKRSFLLALRSAVGDEACMLSAIGVRPQATPELIRKGVLISAECGADGITLGHYDGAPLKNLEAIGQGLADAGIQVASSPDGKQAGL